MKMKIFLRSLPAIGMLICCSVAVTAQSTDKKAETPAAALLKLDSAAKAKLLSARTDELRDTKKDAPKPLVMINDMVVDAKVINILDPSKIESVSVLKDETATAIYGQKAANGVVIIRTKPSESVARIEFDAAVRAKLLSAKMDGVRDTGKDAPKLITVVDGVVTGSSFDKVDPAEIEEISVLKGDAATAVYGPAAADGVIVVKTKRGK